MKILRKDFAPNQPGTLNVIPEEPDDLWLLYNLISAGDVIAGDTTRKVELESTKKTVRVKVSLHLKVTCHDFHKDDSTLRVHGRNLEPNQYVAVGSFHTLTLEKNKPFKLHKKLWDSNTIEPLRECIDSEKDSKDADLAVVLLQQNHAEIYLLGKGITTRCSKIEGSSSARKASSNVFFREVFGAFVKRVDFKAVKSVVIAGDASTKESFVKFMLSEAKRLRMKSIEENKSRIVVAGTGCNGDLREVLGDGNVMNSIKDSKFGMEIKVFKELWEMVSNNSDRVCYGPKHVESANEMRAIETLLITDDLYRNEENETRQKYIGLVKSVKDSGGKALVYSSVHVSAPQLAELSGIAAILRFPLPALEDMHV